MIKVTLGRVQETRIMELKFTLKSIRLLESHFKLNPQIILKKNEPREISCEISVSYKRENKSVGVIISINSPSKDQPFSFNTIILGTFHFSTIPEKKQLDRIVNINCAAIMFPYLREVVADLTRRAEIQPFHLDPINFLQLYEERQKSLTEGNKPQEDLGGIDDSKSERVEQEKGE
jgi:preprotein translocase subunit SecB